MNKPYEVKLDAFEGPLDLLLHLVNQYEIDIYDIPVAKITEQYMHYIHAMQQLELNVASEYLVMAATLLAIKSQMLLPAQEMDEEDDEYMEDPRDELMQRLIEYRKYKAAAEKLKEKEHDEHQIFTRPPVAFEYVERNRPIEKSDTSIYDMLHALEKVFERKEWNKPLETKVQSGEIPIEQRMTEVLEIVKASEKGVSFDHLFEIPSKAHIVATFMAVLELMKEHEVHCVQKKHFDALYVVYMGA
ncbi:segregation/condensation protein A [Virgibacillus siamensis]|uniref:segregation/condensation protein A n=1 Tax=Virgibacillus siamensis TaxID=480071 RepID=UPI0009845205|nr:segregation/condensation protein A [Virgibacillus siamensis]